jgi:hypothetical protein
MRRTARSHEQENSPVFKFSSVPVHERVSASDECVFNSSRVTMGGFVVLHADKFRMPQVIVAGPFRDFDLPEVSRWIGRDLELLNC